MREKYLGDSFDIVKRFWAKHLAVIGPLFAHPRFVPPALSDAYTALTSIPIYDRSAPLSVQKTFGILLDPHTGVPLPSEVGELNASHAPLGFIEAEWQQLKPTYMVCFDQSYHRRHELCRKDQRMCKMFWLNEHNIYSFYYVFARSIPFHGSS